MPKIILMNVHDKASLRYEMPQVFLVGVLQD